MLLGQVFQSMPAWRKLSAVNMKPAVAYKILKYTKLVDAEYEIADKQRVALIHEVTETKEGDQVSIKPGDPVMTEYVERFNEVMSQEIELPKIDLDFGEVIDALDGKDDVLSIADLAILEPFFQSGSSEGE